MNTYKELIEKKHTLVVIGLGYVGIPLAIEFSKHVNVVGFDINKKKIKDYKKGIDPTNEIGNDKIKESSITFSFEEKDLANACLFIVAVPTPVNQDKSPDLSPVIKASEIIGRNIKKGTIVVYESTVYPGVTEDICVPIIEKISNLKCGVDWMIGYSPERINPADKIHNVTNIKKIVSGCNQKTAEEIAKVYNLVVKVGTYIAPSIKIAEAAKVVENSQRDINIAFMNELAMVFDRIGIDTKEVIKAMDTKWNALHFAPGLVGGHCIGVDPYYFTYEAEKLGYHSQIVLSGRKVNDEMGKYIANITIREMEKANQDIKKAKVLVLGATYKENCQDIRNSKIFDIVNELIHQNIEVKVYDPYCKSEDVYKMYGINTIAKEELKDFSSVILAVKHDDFLLIDFDSLFINTLPNSQRVIIDVKSFLNKEDFLLKGYCFWRL